MHRNSKKPGAAEMIIAIICIVLGLYIFHMTGIFDYCDRNLNPHFSTTDTDKLAILESRIQELKIWRTNFEEQKQPIQKSNELDQLKGEIDKIKLAIGIREFKSGGTPKGV